MFTSLDISTSALVAQRTRMSAIAGNIANMSTTHNEAGEPIPYQQRYVVFQADDEIGGSSGAAGVSVKSIELEPSDENHWSWKYQPGHPDAMKSGPRRGYVAYPNINMVNEFVDSLEASRAYEANIGVIEVTKAMTQQALRIVG